MEPFVYAFNMFATDVDCLIMIVDTEKGTAMQEASAIRFGPHLRLAFTTFLIYWNCAETLRDKVTELNPQLIQNQKPGIDGNQHILDNDGLDLK